MKELSENGMLNQQIKVRSGDVNQHRFLRSSKLFDWFQNIAFDHVGILGLGPDNTMDKGLLWVLAVQAIEITRMPRYDETVTLKTWPGTTRMSFFPRFYEVQDSESNTIIRGSSMWGLISETTRTLINPKDYSIHVEPVSTGNELGFTSSPKPIDISSSNKFVVPFSYIDLNGHMNNARYLDLFEDTIPAARQGLEPRFINARYGSETPPDTTLNISWGSNGSSYYATFDSEYNDRQINHFRLRIDY